MREHLIELVEHLKLRTEFMEAGWVSEEPLPQNGVHEGLVSLSQEVYLNSHHELEETLNCVVISCESFSSKLFYDPS